MGAICAFEAAAASQDSWRTRNLVWDRFVTRLAFCLFLRYNMFGTILFLSMVRSSHAQVKGLLFSQVLAVESPPRAAGDISSVIPSSPVHDILLHHQTSLSIHQHSSQTLQNYTFL